jgi:hypothetical protein
MYGKSVHLHEQQLLLKKERNHKHEDMWGDYNNALFSGRRLGHKLRKTNPVK